MNEQKSTFLLCLPTSSRNLGICHNYLRSLKDVLSFSGLRICYKCTHCHEELDVLASREKIHIRFVDVALSYNAASVHTVSLSYRSDAVS